MPQKLDETEFGYATLKWHTSSRPPLFHWTDSGDEANGDGTAVEDVSIHVVVITL